MGKVHDAIDDPLAAWILGQHLFFVGTAPSGEGGHVNVSPKGDLRTFRIGGPRRVAYLDFVGSGVETIAHLRENGRIVVMFCAFDGPPRIVRLHGVGRVTQLGPGFDALAADLGFTEIVAAGTARAIIEVDVTRVADSCGYGVPRMDYVGPRTQQAAWAEKKLRAGPSAIVDYTADKNAASLDGLPGIEVERLPWRTPPAVRALAAGRAVKPVWQNERGGLTFELGPPDRCFVKWSATGAIDLGQERLRLGWAGAHTPVPTVLAHGRDAEGEWLVTAPLPGESAVSERCKADPVGTVRAIGAGLRALHDALPVASCPFSWSVETRLADLRSRQIHPERWHADHRGLDLDAALARLAERPPVDRLVVCHGDACAPNTLVADGRWTGHVDLGALGVADRWADLAIATWSTGWNYGPGLEDVLLEAYGVAPDPERTAYYRLLWDLGP